MKLFFGLASLFLVAFSVPAQELDPYDLGGASKPQPQMSLRAKEGQYKRVHQTALRLFLRGEEQETGNFLEAYLEKNPGDAETQYMLGLFAAQRGKPKAAEKWLGQALDSGLPAGRLIAGPRKMMEPLQGREFLNEVFAKQEGIPVHGPLLGQVTDSGASFWVRTAEETDCRVVLKNAQGEEVGTSEPVRSSAKEDFTSVVRVEGLAPRTTYRYHLQIGGGKAIHQPEWTFQTSPKKGTASKFSLAFGGGAGFVPENERMWDTIEKFSPDLMLLLGDNTYIDDPESVIMQQYTYHRRQSRPEWRRLTAKTPVYTIWDDHDFSTNDSWGGSDIDVPFWKKDWVFPIFRQNWANPGYGGGDDQPGCWYTFSVGDVDFIMLDCRYYRTSPKEEKPSMLGPVQLAWLKQELSASKGTFKVLCSSVPWDFRTKGGSRDTWNGYRAEHEEILGHLDKNKIEGVVLVSADRHRSDCWKLSRPNGYDLYEFNSSRLTNQHVHPRMEKQGALFSFNDPQSFGLVSFDTTIDDPTVTYEIVDIDGKKPHSITVKRSQLK